MQRRCTLGVRSERGSRMNGACFWRAQWAGEVCGKCQKGLWILRRDSWPAINREGDGKKGWLSGEDTSTQPWRSIGTHNKERKKSILEEIKSVETWEHETAWCVPGMQHFHMVAAPSQRRRWQVTEAREVQRHEGEDLIRTVPHEGATSSIQESWQFSVHTPKGWMQLGAGVILWNRVNLSILRPQHWSPNCT